jgi:hypothetical protein
MFQGDMRKAGDNSTETLKLFNQIWRHKFTRGTSISKKEKRPDFLAVDAAPLPANIRSTTVKRPKFCNLPLLFGTFFSGDIFPGRKIIDILLKGKFLLMFSSTTK